METIDQFTGRNYFLSNYYPCNVPYMGINFANSEAAFQAAKTYNRSLQKEMACLPAKGAKKLGRKIILRPDWEQVKDQVMKEVVFKKFFYNFDLRVSLLETGDALLIEGNYWHDNYWGACTCEKCINKPAQNKLGMIVMEVRKDLRI